MQSTASSARAKYCTSIILESTFFHMISFLFSESKMTFSDSRLLGQGRHLSWATWAICSQLLLSSERPERYAHGRSFVLSDLSKSLTVAHLIWAKWANERWANERIPSPARAYIYLQYIWRTVSTWKYNTCNTGTVKHVNQRIFISNRRVSPPLCCP